MRPSFRLTAKILLLALLNVSLLAALFAIFLRAQLPAEFGSFLLGSARERIGPVARLASIELRENGREQWDALLARYASDNGVAFYLFENEGEQLAGPAVPLPRPVAVARRGG